MIKKVWLVNWCDKKVEYFDYKILDTKYEPKNLIYYLLAKDYIILYNGIIDMEVKEWE